jgi:hypothetical protein
MGHLRGRGHHERGVTPKTGYRFREEAPEPLKEAAGDTNWKRADCLILAPDAGNQRRSL